ncbi:MAG: 2,3-bisphosphoglycerate-independent phosphoglycerate mutase [Syntrophus sp. PtaB.Bin138]|nr:MAG: 2,3-bisphosphoglycerate-independent phosphoglycerate mutase [Syntrophus sp. PtaB.Bin138]
MKKLIVILFLLIPVLVSAETNRKVVVISIDALHPDAIEMKKPKNILSVMSRGVSTMKGSSVSPPMTLVNHAAMVVGKTPEQSGYRFNRWKEGDKQVGLETVFHDAKRSGYKTYYIYSKENLGFLVNNAVDQSHFTSMAPREPLTVGHKIVQEEKGDYFLFLHISGLDFAGPRHGWLSEKYLEVFGLIDAELKPIIEKLMRQKNTTLVITSDHSGHDRIHASQHPEDFKIPLIIYSDMSDFSSLRDQSYTTYELRKILAKVLKKP